VIHPLLDIDKMSSKELLSARDEQLQFSTTDPERKDLVGTYGNSNAKDVIRAECKGSDCVLNVSSEN
jgi:hypothetical protein